MQMTHPEAAEPVEVRDDYAAMYASQGWVEVAPAAEPPAPTKRGK